MAETKINFLNGSLFSRFASNPTDASRFLTNNIVEVVTDYMLADPESGFTGVVLSGIATGQNQGSSNYPADAEQVSRSFTFNGVTSTTIHLGVYVRPISRQSSATTDPMKATNQKERSWLIGMQNFAISDKPLDQVGAIPAGSKVMCYYATAPEMGFPEKTLFFKTAELVSNSYLSYISQAFSTVSNISGLFDGVPEPTMVADYTSTFLNRPPRWQGVFPTVPSAYITSPYGIRGPISQLGGGYTNPKPHLGIDISGGNNNKGLGTPIFVVNDGTVYAVNDNSPSAGKMVWVDHGAGWKTKYLHMNSISDGIKFGSKLRKGQQIGTMGSTGNSTGPHLHFDVLKDDEYLDPLLVFAWNYSWASDSKKQSYIQNLKDAGIIPPTPEEIYAPQTPNISQPAPPEQ